MNTKLRHILSRSLIIPALFLAGTAHADRWKADWSSRAPLSIETPAGAPAPDGTIPALVRLHTGNFDFGSAKEDGSDLRFVAGDDKTELPYHIERYDSLVGEAFVWVRVPAPAKAGEPVKLWLYAGNAAAPAAGDAKATYDADTTLVWHFGEHGAPARDWSGHDNNAETESGVAVEGALIGAGLRLDGMKHLDIPAKPSLETADRSAQTISLWIKPTLEQANAVIYSRREGANALVVGLRAGEPYVEVTRAGATTRSTPVAKVTLNKWHQLAVVATANEVSLVLDGAKIAVAPAGLPALKGAARLGGDSVAGATGFIGEIDEFSIAKTARTEGALKFAAVNQGVEGASTITLGPVEHDGAPAGGASEHTGYFKVIVDSLTFDGWVVIGILAVMAVASWVLMITKVGYLNAGSKGNRVFMRGWSKLSRNLHAIDGGDHSKVESLGGILDEADRKAVKNSPIYRIFEVGAEEIRTRMIAEGSSKALTAESIEAIRARLDGTMVRETQKLDKLMVILTISISGGPFLGLLGTVVGVMITFAAVAMAGDVNVNAIAPGISAALLATVAGLAVAIPALFAYNYILGRIKDIKADIQVFIDEFITSMAEFYQPVASPVHERSELENTSGDKSATLASLGELVAKLAEYIESDRANHEALRAAPGGRRSPGGPFVHTEQ